MQNRVIYIFSWNSVDLAELLWWVNFMELYYSVP